MGRDSLDEKGLERDKGAASWLTPNPFSSTPPAREYKHLLKLRGQPQQIKANQGRIIFFRWEGGGGCIFLQAHHQGQKQGYTDFPFTQNRKWGCNLSELSDAAFFAYRRL